MVHRACEVFGVQAGAAKGSGKCGQPSAFHQTNAFVFPCRSVLANAVGKFGLPSTLRSGHGYQAARSALQELE